MRAMRVRVLFFGRLKEAVGKAEDSVELAAPARVKDLYAVYAGRFPAFGAMRGSVVAAVNQELVGWDTELAEGSEVAFLPPVSGGEAAVEDICQLVREPIRTSELVAAVKSPVDGAVCVFDGIVRNHSGGRAVLWLEYEAYETMALGKMREIITAARARYSSGRMALVHRLGRLEIGETSILIAVAAPHRAAAFDACRFAIEAVKRTVPIWKKEVFRDGSVWAEGVPAEPLSVAGLRMPTKSAADESTE
jgi:molybdopterin synthase catalytic subunit